MRIRRSGTAAAIAMSLLAIGCSDDETTTTTAAPTTEAPAGTEAPPATEAPVATEAPAETEAPAATEAPTTEAPEAPAGIALDAPLVSDFVVDGDPSEWADVPAAEVTLEAIGGEDLESKDAVVKVAHDGENVYLLLQVDDDFNWFEGIDPHLTSAVGIEWAIDSGAGGAMGATDDDEETSLGMVDIWHWELLCAGDVVSGGTTSGPAADKDPGNDGACKNDDEYATNPKEREDDNMDGAENSLSGGWSHSNPTDNGDGTWTFEFSRPLDTADTTDTVFAAGETDLLAIAYWDADATPEGWEDDGHVQSANAGWIEVTFAS